MILHLIQPEEKKLAMNRESDGYFSLTIENVPVGTRYFYMPDGEKDFPDPMSHYQPEGVHGASQVVFHHEFTWTDADWCGLPFEQLVMYELHPGTFTPEGNLEAIIAYLDDLVTLGVNAIELMPVAQFPGNRNWGYDGVYPYAVHNSYGGPDGLKMLVDACHSKGIAVFLDIIYNHLGPEGNYLAAFGPYFSGKYHTPWGDALNFDDAWCDGVRDYFANNMLHWFTHYHIDGLRADAVHEVYDRGAVPFWEYCYHKVQELQQQAGRPLYLVAESDLNSPHVIKHPEAGGWGFTAQWLDDFHHALYVLVDKKGIEHYGDFGRMQQLVKAFKEGFVHSGEYVQFRKRRHGASSAGIHGNRFVVFSQNHDIVGNRPTGERLSVLTSFAQLKLAAAAVLLSPYVPMLFMGEEYAAETPFCFFADYSEQQLRDSLIEGRKKEFAAFNWEVDPPDALSEQVYHNCKLQWQQRNTGRHQVMLRWYTQLIVLRKKQALLSNLNKNNIYITAIGEDGCVVHRQDDRGTQHLFCGFNFSEKSLSYPLPLAGKTWQKLLDSTEQQWQVEEERAFVQEMPQRPILITDTDEMVLPPYGVVVYLAV
ncbi:malto-oligosyltrehalose trehalohydrolase [Filimonas lacunae]|nr:malto-oligosyltrehalose trehalohydrolase [Filimonas lacunae]